MKTVIEKIQQLKKSGYTLDFGKVVEETFTNYKKIALISGAVLLLLLFIFGGFVSILSIAFAGIGAYTKTLTGYQTEEFSSTTLIVNLLITVIASALMAPLTAGLLKIAHLAETGKKFDFSTAFDHYKSKYTKDVIVGTIIISFTSQAVTTIFNLLISYNTDLSIPFNFISITIGLFISLLTYMMIPLVIFGDLNTAEAIQASVTVVLQKFWIIILLLIVFILCAFLGIFGFCLGILFTMPILYSLQYILYRNIIGMEETDELDEIGLNTDNY